MIVLAPSRSLSPSLSDYRQWFEAIPDLYVVLAPDLTVLAATDRAMKATRTPRDAVLGKPFFTVFPAQDYAMQMLQASFERVLTIGQSESVSQVKYDFHGGEGAAERYWNIHVAPVLNDSGALVALIAHMEDIAEQLRQQQALHQAEHRYRAEQMDSEIFTLARELGTTNQKLREEYHETVRLLSAIIDSSADAILSTTLEGVITSWNASAEKLFGYREEEIVGRPAIILYPPERLDEEKETLEAARGGERIANRESVRRHKDGRLLDIATTMAPLQDELGRVVGSSRLIRDISSRREVEKTREQLRHAQKMESIGQLTGGIAHDFNNLLAVILGNLDLLAEQLDKDSPFLEYIRPGIAAAEHGAELTRQLLAFGRKQALQPQVIATNTMLSAFLPLVRRTLGERVEITLATSPDTGNIYIDPSLMQNALINLSVNARDAMPEGGKLIYETANVSFEEEDGDLEPGKYVMIAVTDTGSGMPPEILEKVFEPFFTTKEVGKGTGLGLSMVYGFVKQSNGHIRLYSEPGHGTSVKIYLPRVERAPDQAAPSEGAVARPKEFTRILIVEDNGEVLRLTSEMARSLGYQVLEAHNGDEALEILKARDDIALLLTDVMLPGETNGPALARRATELHQHLKVLFNSGYAEQAILQIGLIEKGMPLLSKPFRKQQLAEKLSELLG